MIPRAMKLVIFIILISVSASADDGFQAGGMEPEINRSKKNIQAILTSDRLHYDDSRSTILSIEAIAMDLYEARYRLTFQKMDPVTFGKVICYTRMIVTKTAPPKGELDSPPTTATFSEKTEPCRTHK
jgi:hypothetical protein